MVRLIFRILAGLGVLGVTAAYLLIFQREVAGQLQSDLPLHLQYAQTLAWEPLVYPLFHYSVLAIHTLTSLNLAQSAVLILTTTVVLSGLILFRVLHGKIGQIYPWPVVVLVICALFSTAAVYLPMFCEKIYLCYGSQNSIHNPTTIFSKPFAYLAVILFCQMVIGARQQRLRTSLVTTVMLVLGAFAKPNFALAFIFSAPIFLWWNRSELNDRRDQVIAAMPVIVLAVVLAVQYALSYQFGRSAQDDNHIVFDFLGVARLYSPNPLIAMILLTAFPIATVASYPSMLRDRLFGLTLLTLLVAVAQYWVLAEQGSRYRDGNFGWGLEVVLPLLFALCAAEVMARLRQASSPADRIKAALLLMLFSAHLVSGMLYLKQVLTTSSFH